MPNELLAARCAGTPVRPRSCSTSTGRWPRSSSGPRTPRCLRRRASCWRELARSYALVGCVSGRPALEARRIVGLEEIAYSGNHGFELLLPGEAEPRPDPSLDGHDGDARAFVAGLDQR